MKTKISMKTIYLLLVISIGLVGLGVGSTFAIFTASAEIDNPISFVSNLSYMDNIIETVDIIIPANSSKNVEFNIENLSNKEIKYVTWYIYDGSDSDITFTLGTNSNNDISALPTGTISVLSEEIGIFLDINNNISADVTLTMGVVTDIDIFVLPSYMDVVLIEEGD